MGEGSGERVDLSGLPASTSAFVLSDMREHVLLFCLLGLVLTATIILVAAPGAVTWALALIE
jgi:xanthine/uracil/vitamin C permease (AzgA family)